MPYRVDPSPSQVTPVEVVTVLLVDAVVACKAPPTYILIPVASRVATTWYQGPHVPVITVASVTLCDGETVYVPVPPVPPTRAVMVVFGVTPAPDRTCPTATVPALTAETVRVVPAIVPVTAEVSARPIHTVGVGTVVLETDSQVPELALAFRMVNWKLDAAVRWRTHA